MAYKISDINTGLFVKPCNDTIKENIEYNIYYEENKKGNKPKWKICKFIGLCKDKKVQYVGEIIVCITMENSKSEPHIEYAKNKSNKNQYWLQLNTLIQEKKHEYFEIPQRFYIVENFYQTCFIKTSPYGLRSLKYFELRDYIDNKYLDNQTTASQLAELLKDKTFE